MSVRRTASQVPPESAVEELRRDAEELAETLRDLARKALDSQKVKRRITR